MLPGLVCEPGLKCDPVRVIFFKVPRSSILNKVDTTTDSVFDYVAQSNIRGCILRVKKYPRKNGIAFRFRNGGQPDVGRIIRAGVIRGSK